MKIYIKVLCFFPALLLSKHKYLKVILFRLPLQYPPQVDVEFSLEKKLSTIKYVHDNSISEHFTNTKILLLNNFTCPK